MTKRFTISVPDDVAARLDREPNVSAYLTEVARARIRAEETVEMLSRHMITTSPEGRAVARAKLDEAARKFTPEAAADRRAYWHEQVTTMTAGDASGGDEVAA